MLGSTVLEVAIGLILLFFVLSLLASSAREIVEGWVQGRAKLLQRGLKELLRDGDGLGLVKQVYDHPVISSLFKGQYNPDRMNNLPSYIPARNFALALIDIAARGDPERTAVPVSTPAPVTFAEVRDGVAKNIRDPILQRAVLVSLDGAKDDLEKARKSLEAWYDSSMDRVSGWYRRHTQWLLFGMGLVAAFLFNIDTLRIAQSLYIDDAARAVIVAEAESVGQAAGSGRDNETMRNALGCPEPDKAQDILKGRSCAQARLDRLPYPLGWQGRPVIWPWQIEGSLFHWIGSFPWSAIPGWLLTALAISLGAPFWFDVLNKIMIIRSTVKPHEKSPEEASEDRQKLVAPASSTAA